MPAAQQLGRYQLLDRIAFGGMAEIYRAKTFDQEGKGHLVAVKRVLNHLTADDDFLKMLVDEAKVTASLQHENIARLYEFARTDDDEYFMAMEYVEGKDVRGLLERHRQRKQPMAPEHVSWIIGSVARGLAAAHATRDRHGRSLQIVHRDVSPSNILCGYDGRVKLCDFGIAKATLTRVQTKTGVIKGKVKYMSPEQAMGRKLDHRSDLFSLGTVMYEMLTLEAPFQAATEVELIFAVRDAQKRDARAIVPSLPEELNAIVNKLMNRSRSLRFQSGYELADALFRFLARYAPGYDHVAFARSMRREFAEEIERERAAVAAYVIETADPTRVGENLIADALPADAPYTQFTAAVTSQRDGWSASTLTSGGPRGYDTVNTFPGAAGAGELHAQPTRILMRELPQSASLHNAETRILSRDQLLPNGLPEDLPAGLRPREQEPRTARSPSRAPAGEARRDSATLHDQETQLLSMPETRSVRSGGASPHGSREPKVVIEEEEIVHLGDDDLEPA